MQKSQNPYLNTQFFCQKLDAIESISEVEMLRLHIKEKALAIEHLDRNDSILKRKESLSSALKTFDEELENTFSTLANVEKKKRNRILVSIIC